jgi:hypothetical protein
MATITKRKNGDSFTWRVSIRKKGCEEYRSFRTEEDAKLYAWWKEKLIDNMDNFDIPLNQRITIDGIVEMKINSIPDINLRQKAEFLNAAERCKNFLPNKQFYVQFTLNDWKDCLKKIIGLQVHKGCIGDHTKRQASLSTLRRIFANMSSCVNYARSQNIEIENHPLTILQCHFKDIDKNKKAT